MRMTLCDSAVVAIVAIVVCYVFDRPEVFIVLGNRDLCNLIGIICGLLAVGQGILLFGQDGQRNQLRPFDRVFNVFQLFFEANCVSLQSCKKVKMVEALRRRVELLGLGQSLSELHGRTHGPLWGVYGV